MTDFEQELSDFFSESKKSLVVDPDKFKAKLNIGFKAFSYLSKAENLTDFAGAIAAGVTGSGLAIFSWYGSLGVFAKAGLLVGVVGAPVGLIAVSGAAAASVTLGTTWLIKGARKKLVKEIPSYINTPLDILGASILDLLASALVIVAKSDSDFSESEQLAICDYFHKQWGMDLGIVELRVSVLRDLDPTELISQFEMTLSYLNESKDVDSKALNAELIGIASQIAQIDGMFDEREQQAILDLEVLLSDRVGWKNLFKG